MDDLRMLVESSLIVLLLQAGIHSLGKSIKEPGVNPNSLITV